MTSGIRSIAVSSALVFFMFQSFTGQWKHRKKSFLMENIFVKLQMLMATEYSRAREDLGSIFKGFCLAILLSDITLHL